MNFKQTLREKIADLATKMARRMFTIKEEEKLEETEESNDKTLPTTNLTFKQKLEKRIEESKYTASKTKPLQTSFIKKEMDLFEASLSRGAPERPEHLELLYQSLLTLPPSSVMLLVNAHFQQPDYFQQRFEADLVILL